MLSTNWETFLRTFGAFIAFAILSWVANATNLDTILSPQIATIIAALASTLLAVWDKSKSTSGTVLFGTLDVSK